MAHRMGPVECAKSVYGARMGPVECAKSVYGAPCGAGGVRQISLWRTVWSRWSAPNQCMAHRMGPVECAKSVYGAPCAAGVECAKSVYGAPYEAGGVRQISVWRIVWSRWSAPNQSMAHRVGAVDCAKSVYMAHQ